MTRNFARYEQFLRIHALFDTLANARQPLDDATLIGLLKERLGLTTLSSRTLHRDCEFLLACGYPIDRSGRTEGRRHGWVLHKEALGRAFPGESATILELVALTVARDLLRTFEGTVLWTGMESLRSKIEKGLPPELLERAHQAHRVFHVAGDASARYAAKPRLLSALSTAIAECREIDVECRDASGTKQQRIQPMMLVIELPRVRLAGWPATPPADTPVVIDIEAIEKVTPLDATFTPRPIDPDEIPRATEQRDGGGP